MKNIILFGFMGTGKTAVGQALARKLSMKFIDMDDLIEERERTTISQIFETKGEPHFRKVESEVARDVAQQTGLVVATGGGVVLNHQNIQILENTGIGICLNASPEVIYKRVRDESHRPLLEVDDPMQRIREMLDVRRPFYDLIKHQIDTNQLSITEVIKKITEIVEKS